MLDLRIAAARARATSRVMRALCTLHCTGKLLFFLCCSNPSEVFAIPASTVPTIATHSRLGGQHGEEAKDEGSGKEGRKEDQAPEEEVTRRNFTVLGFVTDSR